MEPDKFLEAVGKLRHSRYPSVRKIPEKVSQVIDAGLLQFSVKQWAEITGTDRKNADYECRYLYEKGWMTRTKDDKRLVYSLRIRLSEDVIDETEACNTPPDRESVPPKHEVAGDSPPSQADFDFWMGQLDASRSENRRMIAVTIRNMKAQGITCFDRNSWMELSGTDREKTRDACDYMVSHNMIRNLYSRRGSALYVFTDSPISIPPELSQPPIPYLQQRQETNNTEHTVTDAFLKRLRELIEDDSILKNKRLFEMFMEMIDDGIYTFVAKDMENKFHMKKTTSCAWLRTALNMGLICREEQRDKSSQYVYYFNPRPQKAARSEGLTSNQRMLLSSLYSAFKNHHFSIHEGAIACGMQDSGFTFHAVNFAERGILTTERSPGQPNSFVFAITPKRTPEFFASEKPESAYHSSASASATAAPVPLAAASG